MTAHVDAAQPAEPWEAVVRLLTVPGSSAVARGELLAATAAVTGCTRAQWLWSGPQGWEGTAWSRRRGSSAAGDAELRTVDWGLIGALSQGTVELEGAALRSRPRLATRTLARLRVHATGADCHRRGILWLEDDCAGALARGGDLPLLAQVLRAVWLRRDEDRERLRRECYVDLGLQAAAWAHDLRNELALARLRLDRLHTSAADTAIVGELAADLARGAQICGGLIAGRARRRERVPLGTLLADQAREAAVQSRRAGRVRVRLRCPADLAARADRTTLARLLRNLLLNALQMTPDGGEVTLTARAHGRGVRVTIRDEGPGMSASRRRRLFARGCSGREGGTGFGTVSVAQCVDVLGAELAIDSTPGRGTKLVLQLEGDAAAAGSGGGDGVGEIHLADHDAGRRRGIAAALRRLSLDCAELSDPEEIESARPRLLVVPRVLAGEAWVASVQRARARGTEVVAHGSTLGGPERIARRILARARATRSTAWDRDREMATGSPAAWAT